MINFLPGWMNFIALAGFYYLTFTAIGRLFRLKLERDARLIVALFYAGAYLSKFRAQVGGGWSFNGMDTTGLIVFGAFVFTMLGYVIFGRKK